jgi:O-antigen/teichoic acid export membrane protein
MALAEVGLLQPARAGRPWLCGRLANFLLGEYAPAQRQAATAFAIRIASAGLIFASQALIARWIGSYAFGTYIYVSTWLLLAGDLVHLGLPLTAQRFVPEYTKAGSDDLLRGYLSGSRWMTFTIAATAAIVAAIGVFAFRKAFDEKLLAPMYLACAALPAYALAFMADGQARSYNWITIALLPAYIGRPLILICIVAALRVLHVDLDATGVMAALVAASWVAIATQLFQLGRRLKSVMPPGRKLYAPKKWLGTALPIVFAWGLYTLLTSTDVLVLKQFRPADDVAHYYAAAKIAGLVSIIYFAVAATTAHRFTTYFVSENSTDLATFAASTVRWVFWPSFGLTLLLLAIGRPLLMIFGADYVSTYSVMAVLAVGLLARASIGPVERVLNVVGLQRKCALAYLAAFTVNISVCLALAPGYGALGVAAATSGAFVVESVLLFIIAKRGLGLHMFIWPSKRRPPALAIDEA